MNGVPCPLASDVARYLWWTECDRSESLGLHVRDLVDELTPFTPVEDKKEQLHRGAWFVHARHGVSYRRACGIALLAGCY